MARISKERLEATRQKLLEQKKTIEAALKKTAAREKQITRKEETTVGMTFWRFVSSRRPELYAEIVESKDFGEYLQTDYQRRLFGRTSLPAHDTDTRGERAGRVYLEVPYGQKNDAKKLGAQWDGSARRWYVPDDLDPKIFAEWLPPLQTDQAPAVKNSAMFEITPDSEDL